MKEKIKRKHLVLIAFIILACLPIILGYLKIGHDTDFHLGRIEGIYHGLRQGIFPLRIDTSKLNGFGYINSMMYPELFLYIPAIFRVLGFNLYNAYRLFLMIIQTSTILITFYAFNRLTKKESVALVATFLYVFSPYRLTNIFSRGAVGEVLAMVFLPLLVLGLYYLIKQNNKSIYIITIAGTGIFQSHMISSEIAILISLIILFLNFKKLVNKDSFIRIILILISCVLLNLWFILPMLQMLAANLNISGYSYNVAERAITLVTIFSPIISDDFLVLTGGIIFNIFIIGSIFMLMKQKKNDRFKLQLFVVGMLLLLCSTELFPWSFLQNSNIGIVKQIISSIQFPWRCLGFSTCLLALPISEYFLSYFRINNVTMFFLIFVGILEVTYDLVSITDQTNLKDRIKSDYTMDIGAGEYLFKGLVHNDMEFLSDDEVFIQKGNIITQIRNNNSFQLNFQSFSNEDNYVELPIFAYPGYKVLMDNEPWPYITTGRDYRLRIFTKNIQNGTIEVYYTGRKIDSVANMISLISWLIFIFAIYKLKRSSNEKNI